MNTQEEIALVIKTVCDHFEKDRVVYKPDLISAYAPTGELFTTFVSGGIKKEGGSIGIYCLEWETAFRWLSRHLADYKRTHEGTIYWRQRPTLNMVTFLKPIEVNPLLIKNESTLEVRPLFFAHCRVLVSSKPIQETVKPIEPIEPTKEVWN